MIDFKIGFETTYTPKAAIFMALGFKVAPSNCDNPYEIKWGVGGEIEVKGKKIDARTALNMWHSGNPLFYESQRVMIDKCFAMKKELDGIIKEIKEEAREKREAQHGK